LSATIAEPVAARIAEKNNLQRDQILLNFAHNHAGPILSLGPKEESDDPRPPRETIQYTNWMMDRLVQVATDALSNLQPSKLSWSTGVANLVMNRREFTANGVILGVNPRVLERNQLTPIAGPLSALFDYVDLPLKNVSHEDLAKLAQKSPGWQMGNAKAMLSTLDRGQKLPTTYRAPVAIFQFGQSLTMVA